MRLCEVYYYTPQQCMDLTLFQIRSLLAGSEEAVKAEKNRKRSMATPEARAFMDKVESWNQ